MYKSAMVHLTNKYPGGKVTADEHTIDAYDAGGTLRVSVRKNGAGMWTDFGPQVGATDAFCLAPIPKQTRLYKEYPDGSIGEHEKYDERAPIAAQLIKFGRVPSIAELLKANIPVDSEGNVQGISKPAAALKGTTAAPTPAKSTSDLFNNASNF